MSNILVHHKTGEVIHIDFGIVFERGKVTQMFEKRCIFGNCLLTWSNVISFIASTNPRNRTFSIDEKRGRWYGSYRHRRILY